MVECGLISPKKGKEVSERLYTIFFETNNLIKNLNQKCCMLKMSFMEKMFNQQLS